MRICNIVLLIAFCFASLPLNGEAYKYIKGVNVFEISETSNDYQVRCIKTDGSASSRNKNIADRQLRLTAVDLMGAYILYKGSELAKYAADYFQVYVDGLNLHYDAYLEWLKQHVEDEHGKQVFYYSCNKAEYNITSASYNSNLNIAELLVGYYEKNRGENAARLLYDYPAFTSDLYLIIENDYLTGNAQLTSSIRSLHEIKDRFELSVYGNDSAELKGAFKQSLINTPETKPYRQFHCIDMVTAAPIKEKPALYKKWSKSLVEDGCVFEAILAFCAKRCSSAPPSEAEATIASIIEAFPGAISPFDIRQPINNAMYTLAAQAYAKSDFAEAARILTESIDTEGITSQSLNLLGASYRYTGNPDNAMPFLLLAFLLRPKTEYLAGNIFLCLKELGFTRIEEAKSFLLNYSIDTWSINRINEI